MLYVEIEKKKQLMKKIPRQLSPRVEREKKEHQIIDCHDRDKLKQYIFKLSKCRKYLTQWFIRLHKFGCVLTYHNNNIKLFKTEIFSEIILSLFLNLSSSSFEFCLK